jgi:hypothetical protein
VIGLRRVRWVGHVALWGRGEVYTGFLWGNLKERDHLENPGIDETIILISGMWWHGLDQSGSG